MQEIIANFYSWSRYLKAVGDNNRIHVDENVAKEAMSRVFDKKDSIGRIAPGMWIASFAERRDTLAYLKHMSVRIEFNNPVLEGQKIFKKSEGDKVLFLDEQGKMYCLTKLMPREENSPINEKPALEKFVTRSLIDEYQSSISTRENNLENPIYYFISLSAPALLEYGKRNNIPAGFHIRQSFNLIENPKIKNHISSEPQLEIPREGNIEIIVGNPRSKGPLYHLDLIWQQEGRQIAYGKSTVYAPK